MIYVSSSCVKNNSIAESVEQLARSGFSNIELSGGTQFYQGFEKDLLRLQDKYTLNYICHNYFPPPEKPFVINVASLDKEVLQLSLENLKKAIHLTKVLGANKFGYHAGFLINIPVNQIGKSINAKELFDKHKALQRFVESMKELNAVNPEVKLYVENNVLAKMNFENFGHVNPFFLCDSNSYKEISDTSPFNLLLDVAHLKVSCQTLGKDFDSELNILINRSDYIHISDNDGSADTNGEFTFQSNLYNQLKNHTFEDKIITLEVYDGIEALQESYLVTEKLIK
jgi:sugar phosphate isomerase/epimerase